jgi:hypothetical protein
MDSSRISKLWFIAACSVLVGFSGCSTTGSTTNTSARSSYNDCFFAVSLTNWRALDDENLILFAGRRRPYHVVLSRPAFGLNHDFMIGVYDRDGRICPFGGDAIVIDGGMPDTIRIRSIQQLSTEQLEQLYVSFGLEDPASVEVAEIEIISDDEEAQFAE